jgi:hypothetical protein
MTEPTYTITESQRQGLLAATHWRHHNSYDLLQNLTPNSGEAVAWAYRLRNKSGWGSWTATMLGGRKPQQANWLEIEVRPLVYGDTHPAPSTKPVACPKCGETEVGTACSPTCGRRDDYAPSTKPAESIVFGGRCKKHALQIIPCQTCAKDSAFQAQGICQECGGKGEQGGQFTSGFWPCEACNGTGKTPAAPQQGETP